MIESFHIYFQAMEMRSLVTFYMTSQIKGLLDTEKQCTMMPDKTNKSGGNVNLQQYLPQSKRQKGREFFIKKKGVDGEPTTNVVEDGESVKQGEQSPVSQLRLSNTQKALSIEQVPFSSELILLTNEREPISFENFQTREDTIQWMKTTQEDAKMTLNELMEFPEGNKFLKNKWVLKLKKYGNKLVKYKVHLIVKDFRQKTRIDFGENFSPIVKASSIKVILGSLQRSKGNT